MFDFKLAFKRAQAKTNQFHQGEIAKKAGINNNTLSAMLYRNSPVVSKVEQIAKKGFGMSASDFIKLGEDE